MLLKHDHFALATSDHMLPIAPLTNHLADLLQELVVLVLPELQQQVQGPLGLLRLVLPKELL
jgi:hypothetical protein